MSAKVKALEWEDCGELGWCADTVVGRYWVGLVHVNYRTRLVTLVAENETWIDIAEGKGFEAAKDAAQADFEQRIRSALASPPSAEKGERKSLNLNIDKDWFEKHAALEGDLEIGAGVPDYLPGFAPSAADAYYNRVIERLMARIRELEAAHPSPSAPDISALVEALESIAANAEERDGADCWAATTARAAITSYKGE
ncbi:MAG TPA: hypothetical protein VIM69_10535 [Opitutaceae bacterium]